MPDSDARTGYGALLKRGDGNSPETFSTVYGIKSMQGPSITRDTHDVTSMTSPGGYKQYIGGLKDGGELTFDANWLPRDPTQSQDDGIMSEFDRDSCESLRNWQVEIPACPGEPAVTFEFAGIYTAQNISISMTDVMTFSGTIKISGRPSIVITT